MLGLGAESSGVSWPASPAAGGWKDVTSSHPWSVSQGNEEGFTFLCLHSSHLGMTGLAISLGGLTGRGCSGVGQRDEGGEAEVDGDGTMVDMGQARQRWALRGG